MAENQVYLIKSGENSFVEETQAIVGISGGKVGIGTTHPEADLHVTGSVKVGGDLTVDGTLTTINSTTVSVDDINIELGSTDNPTDATAEGGGITVKGANDKTFNWYAASGWTSSENLSVADGKHFAGDELRALDSAGLKLFDNNASGITVKAGKVGVHSSNPTYDLDVVGSGNFGSLYVGGNSVLTGTAADLGKWSDGSPGEIYYNGGNVGINTNDPAYTLDVSGSGNFGSLYVGGSQVLTSSDGGLGKWTEGSTAGEIYYTGGNVGIATNDPAYTLDVAGGGNFTSLTVQGNNVLTGSASDLGKWEDAATAGEIYYNGGNVGINTANPSTTLDVNGSLNVEGSFTVRDEFDFGSNGAVGGVSPAAVDDIIKWNGTKWVAGANPGGAGAGGGEVPSALINGLISGQSVQSIAFLDTYDTAPRIATELEIDGEGSIIPYVISGVSTTGYNLIFSQEIPNNNYKIHTVFGGKDVYWETGASNSLSYNDGDVSLQRNLTIGGNLTVNGTQTIVNTETVEIEDHNLVIGANTHYTGFANPYPGAGDAYAGILWGTGDAGAASPVSLTYQSNKGFAFEGGNVGIGTTNPAAKLHVDLGDTGTIAEFRGADTDLLHIDGDSNRITLDARNVGALAFEMQGSEAMRINSDGDVGIGTTAPSSKLDVVGSIRVGGTGSYDKLLIETEDKFGVYEGVISFIPWTVPGSGTSEYLTHFKTRVNAAGIGITRHDVAIDGNVGIGTKNPRAKLDLGTGTDGDVISNTASDYQLGLHAAQSATGDIGRNIGFILGTSGKVGAAITTADSGTGDATDLLFITGNATSISEAMRITSGGNVGIGTTSPSAKLEIEGEEVGTNLMANNNDACIRIRNKSDTDGNFASLDFHNSSNFITARIGAHFKDAGDRNTSLYFATRKNEANLTQRMTIDEDGNVGIGTTSPAAKLDLQTSGHPLYIRTGAGANDNLFVFENPTAGPQLRMYEKGTSNVAVKLSTHDDSYFKGGNVGIGTTNPIEKLHVNSGTGNVPALFESLDSLSIIQFKDNSTNTEVGIGALANGQVFYAGNAERMRIDSAGNVGIGTTSPGAKLQLQGDLLVSNSTDNSVLSKIRIMGTSNASGDGHIIFQNNVSTGSRNFYIGNDITGSSGALNGLSIKTSLWNTTSWAEATTRLHITDVGNVGIGTTNPAQKLDVHGNIAVNGVTVHSSDDRVKHNEQPIVGALETLSKITPKKYIKTIEMYDADHDFELDADGNPIDENGEPVEHAIEAGVIAQQVLTVDELAFAVSPEGVDEDGTVTSPHGLDYNSLFTYAIAAIQEQQQLIDDLKSQNESLAARISALES